MSKVIIYPQANGCVAVVRPIQSYRESFSDLNDHDFYMMLGKKDVPAGLPYLIIDKAELPEDRTYRNGWEADFTTPDGYGE